MGTAIPTLLDSMLVTGETGGGFVSFSVFFSSFGFESTCSVSMGAHLLVATNEDGVSMISESSVN